MVLRDFIYTVLVENRVDDAKRQYPNVDVDKLVRQDPSQNNKYLQWMAKQIDRGHKISDIAPTILYFHRNNQRFKVRDIYAYDDLKDLEDTVKDISSKKTVKQTRVSAQEGVDRVYENDDIVVMYIKTKDACVKYGQNTRWCITMEDAEFFEQYEEENAVFYFVLRKNPEDDEYDKVAIAVMRRDDGNIEHIEIYDARDNLMSRKLMGQMIPNSDDVFRVIMKHAPRAPLPLRAQIWNSWNAREGGVVDRMSPDLIKQALEKFHGDSALESTIADIISARLYQGDEEYIELAEEFIKDKDVTRYVHWVITQFFDDQTAAHKDFLEDLATDTTTPTHILARLLSFDDRDIAIRAVFNPSTKDEDLSENGWGDSQVAAAVRKRRLAGKRAS